MSKPRGFAPGQYCHIYNRGVDKRPVFQDEQDRFRFLCYLVACNGTEPVRLADENPLTLEGLAESRGETLVDLCAYCLMDNHFHMVIRIKKPEDASRFLQKMAGYTEYFNSRHGRSGSLFQGVAKSRVTEDSSDLLGLIAYVNLNPIEKEVGVPAIARRLTTAEEVALRAYPYSSLPDYLGTVRPEGAIINKEALPPGFGRWPILKL